MIAILPAMCRPVPSGKLPDGKYHPKMVHTIFGIFHCISKIVRQYISCYKPWTYSVVYTIFVMVDTIFSTMVFTILYIKVCTMVHLMAYTLLCIMSYTLVYTTFISWHIIVYDDLSLLLYHGINHGTYTRLIHTTLS
jgi:hypothetical protein